MADCPTCHAANRDSARFCLNCGHALQSAPATPPAATVSDSCACPSCGEENRAGRKFCKRCGSAMSAATLAATDGTPETAPVGVIAVAVVADAPAGAASAEDVIEPVAAVLGDAAAAQPEQNTSPSAPASAESPSPEAALVVTEIVTERAPEPVLAVEAVPEAVATESAMAGVSQVSAAIDSAVTGLAADAATAAAEAHAPVLVLPAAPATLLLAEAPEAGSPVAPTVVAAGKAAAANVARAVAPAARPWWHWAAGALLLGMAVAAMMLSGVFSRGAQPAATPVASAPAAIALQPGTWSLQEQAAAPAGSSAAAAVAPVVAPVVAAPPVQSPASEPIPAPAPANDAPAVPQPMPEIKPATRPAAVAPVAKAAPKSEAKAGSQHDEIRRKKEELKRQLGLQ